MYPPTFSTLSRTDEDTLGSGLENDVPPPLGLSRSLSSFTTTGLSFTFTIFPSLSVVSLPPLNVVP